MPKPRTSSLNSVPQQNWRRPANATRSSRAGWPGDGSRSALEEHLAAAEIAREDDSQTHAAELASLNTRFGEREAQHEVSPARINRICTGLQQRLLELEAAIRTPKNVMRRTRRRLSGDRARQK